MDENRRNKSSELKRRIRRFATFLLFFYLIGNLTVLEYFGGNPELGIESYTEVAAIASVKAEGGKKAVDNSITNLFPSSPQKNGDLNSLDADDCLASCTHSLTNNFVVENYLPVIVKQVQNPITKHLQANPHLMMFYRPPRIA